MNGAGMLVLAVAVSFQPDARRWEAFTSPEGRFTVEMPGAPNRSWKRSMTDAGGSFELVFHSCQAGGATYTAQKLTGDESIAAGARQAALEHERDAYLRDGGGQLADSRRIALDGNPGLEFTAKEPSSVGQGEVEVRTRLYLVGNSYYLLTVTSRPGLNVPPEADRFLNSLRPEAAPRRPATAAPTKPPTVASAKPPKDWGDAIDPDGDCRIRPDGRALVMEVPGTLHDMNADIGVVNAPRVLRDVRGDFAARVAVVGDFQPGAPPTGPRSLPYHGGGFLVWLDDANYIRVERAAVLRNGGRIGTFLNFERRRNGRVDAAHNGPLDPGTAHLRIERRGNQLLAWTSPDGSNWTALRPMDCPWPAALKVGLDAVNSSSTPLTVRFEDFSVGPPDQPGAAR
jgi:regulation of enolase protein 1 (concanavalin A-like superfamily)